MRPAHVPDEQLTPADLPAVDAPVDELLAFGHRYHAYRVAGSLPRVGAIAVELHDRWVTDHRADPGAVLDEPLSRLRVALFHTARATAHDPAAAAGGGDAVAWLRVLVRSVAAHLTEPAHD